MTLSSGVCICMPLLFGISLFCAAESLAANRTIPVPDHVVIVMEENHGYSEIIGSNMLPI